MYSSILVFFLCFLVLCCNSHCVYLFPPIQLSFLLLIIWTLYLVSYVILLHHLFYPQKFPLTLSIDYISSFFSFSLIFFVYLKLGETVTFHSLKVVSFCESIPVQSECPVALVKNLNVMWMHIMSFIKFCWQLSPW